MGDDIGFKIGTGFIEIGEWDSYLVLGVRRILESIKEVVGNHSDAEYM